MKNKWVCISYTKFPGSLQTWIKLARNKSEASKDLQLDTEPSSRFVFSPVWTLFLQEMSVKETLSKRRYNIVCSHLRSPAEVYKGLKSVRDCWLQPKGAFLAQERGWCRRTREYLWKKVIPWTSGRDAKRCSGVAKSLRTPSLLVPGVKAAWLDPALLLPPRLPLPQARSLPGALHPYGGSLWGFTPSLLWPYGLNAYRWLKVTGWVRVLI